MRRAVAVLSVALAACGGSGGGVPFCELPAPRLANLNISPDSAAVGSHGGQVFVDVSWEVLTADAAGPLSTVIVFDSTGQEETRVNPDLDSTSTAVPISTAMAAQYTIEVTNLGVCIEESNTLRGVFEIVEVADVQSNYRVTSGAILGSLSFDVTQIDFSTVAYGPAKDQTTLNAYFKDVNGDGFIDCIFQINLSEIDIGCCDSGSILHGRTYSGTAFAELYQQKKGIRRRIAHRRPD